MSESNLLHQAITQWQSLLGCDNVCVQAPDLINAATATFLTSAEVLAILTPDRTQLADCLKIANQYQIALYPISSGKNWGYGSRVPSNRQAVLIDLVKLKTISEYDTELHVIRVEAGVTQLELCNFLQQQGDNDWMDCTGSHPSCSVVGNTVERGFGHTPYGEHANFIAAMEVMLADGSVIQTGMQRFPGAKAAGLYKWGLGPGLDQLFLQSNLGIVLSIKLWLMPKPEKFLAYYLSADNDEALELIVEALTPLRRAGIITSLPHIANEFRVLGGMQQYPWDKLDPTLENEHFPLSNALTLQLRKRWQVGAWNLSGALYGTKEQVANAKKQLKKALDTIPGKRLNFVSDHLLDVLERFQRPIAILTRIDIPGILKVLRPVHNMMKGIPSTQFLSSAYWRKRTAPSVNFNLEQDAVGLIWCAFVGPADATTAREMFDIVLAVLPKHGFEPGVTITLLNERCLDVVISLLFDRSAEPIAGISWDQKAISCRSELYQMMFSAGYFPYRVDVDVMKLLTRTGDSAYLQLLEKLKLCLDPHQVIAPGRYIAEIKNDTV